MDSPRISQVVRLRIAAQPARGSQVGDKTASPGTTSAAAPSAAAASPIGGGPPRRAMTWQLPSLVLGAGLIALGLYTFSNHVPADDFDGALGQVESLLGNGKTADAAQILRDRIEPSLPRATEEQTARFHALMADRHYLDAHSQAADEQAWLQVAEHYASSAEHSATLSAERLERWAIALVELGDLDGARARHAAMKAQAMASGGDKGSARRCASVLRRIVTASVCDRAGTSVQAAMSLLSEYRADPMLTATDEAWAAARQAELRLLDGRAQEAVDRLLIDIRRVEQRAHDSGSAEFAELLLLLGRAQHELGSDDDAQFALDLALQQMEPGASLRGEAIELLGRVALSRGEAEPALEHFDSVVRDYVGTPAHLSALLGRAEVRGMMGEHEQSLEDFHTLRELLGSTLGKTSPEPMRDRLAVALTDRHDAALATGNLDLALRYLQLAERCYPGASAPIEIVHRMATTSRQRADDLAAAALKGQGEAHHDDSSNAGNALALYRQAGDNFVRHARAVAADAGQDSAWADSLWLAADSYERANWPELALEHFREYLAASPRNDPRRAEAMFRMAQAHHAMTELDRAVEFYERVIQENPRSPFAAESHVPLARCYVALNRRPEAEQQLRQVLDGQQLLTPDASGYREAQFQLGAIYFQGGEYVRAIETLDAAITASPDDARADEARLQLAECYLKHALSLNEQLAAPDIGMTQRSELQRLQEEQLSLALDLYRVAIQSLEHRRGALDPLARDALRGAYLARADCAFQLGQFDRGSYEMAADLYDQAARRYSDQSMSLTALVQMVNCFHALDDPERARAAQLRAQARLEQLPDHAFDAPDALLDRQAWERWLRNAPPAAPGARAAADSMEVDSRNP